MTGAASDARRGPVRTGAPDGQPPRSAAATDRHPPGPPRLQSGHALRHPRPHRAQPDRTPAHRHRANGAVQLPVRAPHGGHVHPPARGHGRRPEHGGVREGHPRRPALAGDHLGRGSGCRGPGGSGPVCTVPADGAPPRVRGGGRAPPRRGPRLPLLLLARGACRGPPGPGSSEAPTTVRRPLRRRSHRPSASRARPRAAGAPSGSASRRAWSAGTTSCGTAWRSTRRTSAATS